jgi:hypothetical protein
MAMIPCSFIRGNQFDKAFEHYDLPVVATDLCTFRVPSSSEPGETDHLVRIDDPERPRAVSCTCMAGRLEKPCWAMARALVALDELLQANVWLFRGAASAQAGMAATAGALVPHALAMFDEAGEPVLSWRGVEPEVGLIYSTAK